MNSIRPQEQFISDPQRQKNFNACVNHPDFQLGVTFAAAAFLAANPGKEQVAGALGFVDLLLRFGVKQSDVPPLSLDRRLLTPDEIEEQIRLKQK